MSEKQRFRTSARLAVRADIARVEIVASLRVTYTIFHNFSIVNSASWGFYARMKKNGKKYICKIYVKVYKIYFFQKLYI